MRGIKEFVSIEDIIYSLIEEGLKKIEPVIIGFNRETTVLKNLSLSLTYHERMDFVRRIYLAQEMMKKFHMDLELL